MTRVLPMEPSTAWLLFVLTMVIHVTTFFILQAIADQFKNYISKSDTTISAVNGVSKPPDSDPTKKNAKTVIVSSGKTTNTTSYRDTDKPLKFDYNSRGNYQELHNTLDVSVFQ
jgi:hypothetical protein